MVRIVVLKSMAVGLGSYRHPIEDFGREAKGKCGPAWLSTRSGATLWMFEAGFPAMTVLDAGRVPTRGDALLFALKTNLLRGARVLREIGRTPRRLPRVAAAEGEIVAEQRSPLWG